MNGSHQHIEELLGRQAETGSLSAGFRERVAEGISRAEPGALPVGNPIMPASVKGAITLGAIGVISAGVWFAVLAQPSATSVPSPNTGNPTIVENTGAKSESVFATLADISKAYTKRSNDPTDFFTEGRRLFADVVRVGEAFASVFPSHWRDLLLGPSRRQPSTPAAEPAVPGVETGTLNG